MSVDQNPIGKQSSPRSGKWIRDVFFLVVGKRLFSFFFKLHYINLLQLPADWPSETCVLNENVQILVSLLVLTILTAIGVLGFITEYTVVKSEVDTIVQ